MNHPPQTNIVTVSRVAKPRPHSRRERRNPGNPSDPLHEERGWDLYRQETQGARCGLSVRRLARHHGRDPDPAQPGRLRPYLLRGSGERAGPRARGDARRARLAGLHIPHRQRNCRVPRCERRPDSRGIHPHRLRLGRCYIGRKRLGCLVGHPHRLAGHLIGGRRDTLRREQGCARMGHPRDDARRSAALLPSRGTPHYSLENLEYAMVAADTALDEHSSSSSSVPT